MRGVPLSAILDGASRLLDIGGTRALRGREDENDAVLRDLRDAWADVAGELRAVVAGEIAALARVGAGAPPPAIDEPDVDDVPGGYTPVPSPRFIRSRHPLIVDDQEIEDAMDRLGAADRPTPLPAAQDHAPDLALDPDLIDAIERLQTQDQDAGRPGVVHYQMTLVGFPGRLAIEMHRLNGESDDYVWEQHRLRFLGRRRAGQHPLVIDPWWRGAETQDAAPTVQHEVRE